MSPEYRVNIANGDMMKEADKKNEVKPDEEIQAITLEDSNGDEIVFEVTATLEYMSKEYIVLLPLEEYGDPDEYTILEFKSDSDGNISEFHGIDDLNTLTAVYKKFCEEIGE